ncbi:hypothetical protein [Mycoplasmopsis agalactiae]|uniref:hypothetical protein n=1 Tax=Mycoplasmopsis agalactiae TaxID=2110 RepID=UPI0003194671|nr:hypothetical protein [Mycoplasmopsis agalactiae]
MAYADEFEKANKEYEAFTKSDENAKWEKAEKAAEFKRKYDVDREKLEKDSEDILDNSAAANGISKWEGGNSRIKKTYYRHFWCNYK